MSEEQVKSETAQEELSELLKVRREKLTYFQEAGRDPFQITKFTRTAYSSDIKNDYDSYEEKTVSVCGRMMSKRGMGKAIFCNIKDDRGQIQLYIRSDAVSEQEFADFRKYDIGDIIGVTGYVFKTKTGEITIHAEKTILLSKNLRPLPEKFHGMTNTDLRYRQRYADLIMNDDSKRVFVLRSKFISYVRRFLDGRGYLEVETPVLNTISGGATARPFITHHNTLDLDMYLRIATELNLKRLIVGGMERVYEIGRIFRNEGMDTKHNPEFTSVELYESYADFNDMMDLFEDLLSGAAMELLGTYDVEWQGEHISLAPGFRRMTMAEAVKEYLGIDFMAITSDEEAVEAAKSAGVDMSKAEPTWGHALYECYDQKVEEKMIQPTFITMHPVDVSPLAKRSPADPRLTERFELFICRSEMGNAFSELNDPIDQKQRFQKQVELRNKGDDEAGMMDTDFINALEYGMPPTGGLGIGIDRCVMLLTGCDSIRDVILFPTMKPEGHGSAAASKKAATQVRKNTLNHEAALELLKKYNKDPFHIRHALTVEGVMKWYANDLGFSAEQDYWATVGLLHDIDFEMWPEEHCKKAPELLKEAGVSDDMIHAVCSHGYGLCSDIEPEHIMEKVLFAADELTGLIWSAALMRPSKSCKDMELSSLKKKFKDKKFAAGCSRDVIKTGAEALGWELDQLLEKTLEAMKSCEDAVAEAIQ